jgi:hypothetical protein
MRFPNGDRRIFPFDCRRNDKGCANGSGNPVSTRTVEWREPM